MNQQPEGIPVDPVVAFETFQQYHGLEMGRMAGEFVRVNTYCQQLQQENQALQERLTALEQNAGPANGNGKPIQGGAKLEEYPLPS